TAKVVRDHPAELKQHFSKRPMLDILELPKAEPIDDHAEGSVDHRYHKQSGEAHAVASQQQLRRARENMRQRDGEDKGYKDADVLEHERFLPATHRLRA